MLLSVVLSNFVCLLLPALISARATAPKDTVNLASHHVRRLSTPLKNLLHKREAILFAGSPDASNALALNSTNGQVVDTIPFEAEIDLPGPEHQVYFLIKGEIDEDYSVTVEDWVHYQSDEMIGVFYGDLIQGVDMKIPASVDAITGEARLYVVTGGVLKFLVFEAYGSVHLPSAASKAFRLKKEIKMWSPGNLKGMKDVPNNSGIEPLSSGAGVDPSLSVE